MFLVEKGVMGKNESPRQYEESVGFGLLNSNPESKKTLKKCLKTLMDNDFQNSILYPAKVSIKYGD